MDVGTKELKNKKRCCLKAKGEGGKAQKIYKKDK